MKLITLPILLVGVISYSVYAEKCDVSFKYGVVIDPLHVRLLKEGEVTYIQITRNRQLFISGREIMLNTKQIALLSEYSKSIRHQVPEIVSIAIEGVDVGLDAVNKAIGGLIGQDNESHRLFQKRFNDMQWNLRSRFNHSDQSYYIAPQNFNDFDEIFSGEFEKEIEHIVTQSLGSILMAVGDAIVQRTDRNQDKKKDNKKIILNNEMTNLEKELISELSTKTYALDQKAKVFCENLKELNKLENKIRSTIPNLNQLDLIENNVPTQS